MRKSVRRGGERRAKQLRFYVNCDIMFPKQVSEVFMAVIGNKWDEILGSEYARPYFDALMEKVKAEYRTHTVFPPFDLMFAALKTVDYDDVKVVILGQDPYHGDGQANGMAFAVGDGIELPPSLKNIYAEIESDMGVKMPQSGSLLGWAKQGVLLLNTVLTVRRGVPQSHAELGWKTFTDAVIAAVNRREKPVAFVLWGANAISKRPLIDERHFVITSPHPSPLSAYRGFFGSKPFSRVNEFLARNGLKPIDWSDVDGREKAGYYDYPPTGSIRRA